MDSIQDKVNPTTVDKTVKKPRRRAGFGHYLALFYEVCLLGLVLLVGGLAVLLWQLQKADWQAEGIKVPLQAVLASMVGAADVQIENPILRYNKADHSLALRVKTLQIYPNSAPLVAMRDVDLSISVLDLLFGHVYFPNVSVTEMGLRLDISPELDVALSTETNVKAERSPTDLGWVADLMSRVGILRLNNVTLSLQQAENLRVFRNIKLTGDGQKGKSAGTLALEFSESLVPLGGSDRMGLAYQYDKDAKQVSVALYLPKMNPKFFFNGSADLPVLDTNVSGQARIDFSRMGRLKRFDFSFNGDAGNFAWPSVGIADKPIRRIMAAATYDAQLGSLKIGNTGFMLRGVEMFVSGALERPANKKREMVGTVRVMSPVIALPMIAALWPAPKVVDPQHGGAREWLVDRMQGGRMAGISADIPVVVKRNKQDGFDITVDENNILAEFRYADINLDYHDHLRDLAKLTGYGRFANRGLELTVTDGVAGKLQIRDATFGIDDLITAGTGTAHLDVSVQGPAADLIAYLSVPPIDLHERVDARLKQLTGTGIYDAKVTFPITKDAKVEDVKVQAGAVLRNIDMPNAVRQANLTGGPFVFKLQDDTVTLSGTGQISGQPIKLNLWQTLTFTGKAPTDPSMRLSAQVTSDTAGRRAILGKIADQITGNVPIDIVYNSQVNGAGILTAKADAAAAVLDFSPFNVTKPENAAGKISLVGILQHGVLQSVKNLDIATSSVALKGGVIQFAPDGTITNAQFNQFRAGETTGNLIYAFGNAVEKINFTGAAFDARRARKDSQSTSAHALDLTVDAKKLWLGEAPLTATNLSIQKNSSGILTAMRLNGLANGSPVAVNFTPAKGLQVMSENAGFALEGLGITDRVKGGTLAVNLTPAGNNKYEGKLDIRNFSVTKAPALAKLINLLSVPGLLNILNADTGLSFAQLDSKMVWLNQSGGGIYQFRDGRTTGSSLGLTFEGETNVATNQIAINGTAVPMSEVNSLLGGIPILGDLLTGGGAGKGIFAATYSMSGQADDPKVSVNPLSVLAPGILRRILFEGAAPKTKN